MAFPLPDPAGTCLVTGASSGIGEEIARELASRGYNVTLAARRERRIARHARRLAAEFDVDVDAIACDVTDPDSRKQMLKEIKQRGKRIDILVNNAGFATVGRFFETDGERQLQEVATNVTAVVALTHPIVREMVRTGSGAILNVASVASFQPLPNEAVYSATKVFSMHFSEALHTELKGTGVTCTVLCPGLTRTEISEVAGVPGLEGSTPNFLWSSPEDVAREGVDAMERGHRVCVPGKLNKINTLVWPRLPRGPLLSAIAFVNLAEHDLSAKEAADEA